MLRTLSLLPSSLTDVSLADSSARPDPAITVMAEQLSGRANVEFNTAERVLVWARDGDFIIDVNQHAILCHTGDAVLLNSGLNCRLQALDTSLTSDIYSLSLSPEGISAFTLNYNTLAQRQKHTPLQASNSQDWCHLPRLLQQQIPQFVFTQLFTPPFNTAVEEEKISTQLHEQSLIHLLLNTLVERYPQVINILCDPIAQPLANHIRALVMADLSHSWSIPELAQTCHMSEATLRRKATKEVGSLVNFIHEIKMLEALRLLRQSSLPITQIAGNLGYGSAAYFSSLFHQRFSICPRSLRKAPQSIG